MRTTCSTLPGRRAIPVLVFALMAALAGCGGSGGGSPAIQVDKQGFAPGGMAPVSNDVAGVSQAANAEIDSVAQDALKTFTLPGAVVVAMQDGKIIYAKAYGYASLEQRTPMKPEDTFFLCSISKQFVASAAMLLVEEGKLSLDAPISRYFADLPTAWGVITLRQLLSHTAGLAEEPAAASVRPLEDYNRMTDTQRLAALTKTPMIATPGQRFEYSNLGYGVAALLVSKASGKDYFEFIQERIFRPLGMASARQVAPGTHAVSGYRPDGNLLQHISYTDPMLTLLGHFGAGSVEMNALDMAKWEAALLGERILKQSSLAEMWKQQVATGADAGYGLGWFTFDNVNGRRIVMHPGSMDPYHTVYRRFPDERFSVVVLTNRALNDVPVYGALHIAREVTRILRPELKV